MKKIALMIALGIFSATAIAQQSKTGLEKIAVESQRGSGITVGTEVLKKYEGRFELMPNFNITFTVKKGKLISQATGQVAYELIAQGDHTFVPTTFPAKITFIAGKNGEFSSLLLEQGGQEMKAPRLDD